MQYSEEQQQVIEYSGDYQQVIAGAGSGKTFTMIQMLVKLIHEGKEKQREILVITFSKKAVTEISERLEKAVGKHQIKIQTFHAYCLYILKKYHPKYSKEGMRILLPEDKEKIFREFFVEKKFVIGGIPYDFFLQTNSMFLKTHFPDLEHELLQVYQDYKDKNNLLDFDDLVNVYLRAMQENKDWARQARQEVKRVIVDEFQDTDLTQLEWLKMLQPQKLTVVGDDWQAIYGFRGASVEPFLKFKDIFSPCQVNFLCANYRSLKEIVKIAHLPIQKNKNNIKKKTLAQREGKGTVHRANIESDEDLQFLCYTLLEEENFAKKGMLLCRSNFRLQTYHKLGIPQENLMTIHASKGLEFPYVLVDLAGGWNVKTDAALESIEEERRILYVALSRAKDKLLILGNPQQEKKSVEHVFFAYFHRKVASLNLENLSKFFN
ncbi:MAG: UvrD-helicase domain-containing protein [Spirochaetota bacterium]